MEQRILRRRQVERQAQLSKATIYRMIKAGTFPRPVKLGPRAVGWLKVEIEDWIANRERA